MSRRWPGRSFAVAGDCGAVLLFGGAAFCLLRLGQEFTPTFDEKNIVMDVKRIPSTSLVAVPGDAAGIESMVSRFPQVAFVFSSTGTPDLAAIRCRRTPRTPSSS